MTSTGCSGVARGKAWFRSASLDVFSASCALLLALALSVPIEQLMGLIGISNPLLRGVVRLLCNGCVLVGMGALLKIDFRVSFKPSGKQTRVWTWAFLLCLLDFAFVSAYALAHGAELRVSASWFQWNAIPALALAAASEELLTRGLVLGCLEHAVGGWLAWPVQALVFQVMHSSPSPISAVLLWPHFLSGLIYGLLALRSGSIWPGAAFHLFVNAMATLIGAGVSVAVPVGPGAAFGALWSLEVPDYAWYMPARQLMYVAMLAVLLGATFMRRGRLEPGDADRADPVAKAGKEA